VGHADAFFTFRPNSSIFHDIKIGANANQYHFYQLQQGDVPVGSNLTDRRFEFTKVAPEIDFDFRKNYARSPISQTVRFRTVWLKTDEPQYRADDTVNNVFTTTIFPLERTFYELSYIFTNSRRLHPYDFNITFQTGDFMSKLQFTGNYHINISAKKTIDIRLFAGTFLSNTSTHDYRFRMSGWGPLGFGNQDYLFDNIFIGRSEKTGLSAQQMTIDDGGFKIFSAVGQSDRWLTSMNIVVPLPVKNRFLGAIKFYGDFGMFDAVGLDAPRFEYDAGIQVSLLPRDICNVYFPLVYSQDIKDYNALYDIKFKNMIRFTFNLNKLNPFKLINNIQI
jgi:hypothetical protein